MSLVPLNPQVEELRVQLEKLQKQVDAHAYILRVMTAFLQAHHPNQTALGLHVWYETYMGEKKTKAEIDKATKFLNDHGFVVAKRRGRKPQQ